MTLEKKLESSLKKQIKNATDRELYDAIVAIVKEEQDHVKKITGEKKLYYISAEFLIGKQLGKNLINLGLYDELAKLLIQFNISISSVESFTVGNFATMLGSVPGISKVYKGSLITYQNETKERLLSIPHDVIEKYGVVSKEIASLMCINGKQILDSDICISFTGNAGPDAMEGKPVGLVYIGILYKGVNVYELNLKGTRQEIQQQAIDFVIRKLIEKFKVN